MSKCSVKLTNGKTGNKYRVFCDHDQLERVVNIAIKTFNDIEIFDYATTTRSFISFDFDRSRQYEQDTINEIKSLRGCI